MTATPKKPTTPKGAPAPTTPSDPNHIGDGSVKQSQTVAQDRARMIQARLERVLADIVKQPGWPLPTLTARGLLVTRSVERSAPAVVVNRTGPQAPGDPTHPPFAGLPAVDTPPTTDPSPYTSLPLHVRRHVVDLGPDDGRISDLSADPGEGVAWIDHLARTARGTQVLDVLQALIGPGDHTSETKTEAELRKALVTAAAGRGSIAVIIGGGVAKDVAEDWIKALPDGAAIRLPADVDARVAGVVGDALLLQSTVGPPVTVSRAWDVTAEVHVQPDRLVVTVSERRALDRRPTSTGEVTATGFTLGSKAKATPRSRTQPTS